MNGSHTQHGKGARFQALHQAEGLLLIPNPWDAGSARILAQSDFDALATSSAAFAATLGRRELGSREDGRIIIDFQHIILKYLQYGKSK